MLNRRSTEKKINTPTPPQSKDRSEDQIEDDSRTPLTDEQFSKVKEIIKEVVNMNWQFHTSGLNIETFFFSI